MKTVCRALGVARSQVHELHHRSEDWRDGRKGRTPAGDVQLLAEIREQITDLPSYGYRRACALVNRRAAGKGQSQARLSRDGRIVLARWAPTAPVSKRTRVRWWLDTAICAGVPMGWRSSATRVDGTTTFAKIAVTAK
jgi:hypothetical protein